MFGAVFDIQQPYHPSWQHPRYDLALRYLEIVLSIVVIALAFPYIFRTPPDTVKNAYFVFTMLLGIFTTTLTIIICAARIWLLHFRPARALPQSTSSSSGPQKWPWTRHCSRANQDAGLLLFWVWWNVARLLPLGGESHAVSDLLSVIISIIDGVQIFLLIFSVQIGVADESNVKVMSA